MVFLSEKIARTRSLMDDSIPDSLATGYGSLIPSLHLPDPDDRHVLAAAITCRADVIVTFNLRDFPPDSLRPFEIEAQHPDEFIRHAIDFDQATALAAIKRHRAALAKPIKSAIDFIDTLTAQGLPKTANALKP